MPPRCTACSHPKRAEIDAAMVAGESLRNIAQRFGGPSAWSIYRHTKHAQAVLCAGIRARNDALTEGLYAELDKILSRELEAAQSRLLTLTGPQHMTAAQWKDAFDGMFGSYVRIISYLLRLLRDGADSPGPNSRIRLIQGISDFPEAHFPTLRRMRLKATHTRPASEC